MRWPEPTRVVSCLALAWASVLIFGCQRPDPGAALPVARTPELRPAEPLATATLASSAVLPAEAGSEPTATHPVKRVLVLGDSLTDESVGGGGFVKLLRERCPNVPFDNRAKGGFMVNQMRKRLETEVLPEGQSYSHAIVFGGVNDLYSDQTANRSLARIQGDLTRIYVALKARSIDVITITVTPWGGFKRWYTPERGQNTLTLNRWIADQAAQSVTSKSLDAYPLLSCGNPELLCPELAAPFKDGLHFGKLGQHKLGEALYELAFAACRAP